MKNEKNKKSKVQQIGISLLMLIVVAVTLACTNKAEDGGLTITGLDAYNGKYILALAWLENPKPGQIGGVQLTAANSIKNGYDVTLSKIDNGSVTTKVWKSWWVSDEEPYAYAIYKGNDTVVFGAIWIHDEEKGKLGYLPIVSAGKQMPITFKNGIAKVIYDNDPNWNWNFWKSGLQDDILPSYYAKANLRLRSEPDTSKDNRIAGVPQGSKVEWLETGERETIDDIEAPWYKVKTEDGTVGWLFSGYLTEEYPAVAPFVGTYVDVHGNKKQIEANGSVDGYSLLSLSFDKISGSYILNYSSRQEFYTIYLFPVGVAVYDEDGKLVKTDKTKIRLNNYHKASSNDALYYLQTSGTAATPVSYDYSKILKGDFSELAKGSWEKSTGNSNSLIGDNFKLRADGTFADGEKASTAHRNDNGSYSWSVRSADGGGFGVMLFPAGVEDLWTIPTDKTKVRMTMGQDFDPESSPVYYYNP